MRRSWSSWDLKLRISQQKKKPKWVENWTRWLGSFPPRKTPSQKKKKPHIVQPHLYIRPHILEPKLENRDCISPSQLRTQVTKGKLLTGSITENGQATTQGQRRKRADLEIHGRLSVMQVVGNRSQTAKQSQHSDTESEHRICTEHKGMHRSVEGKKIPSLAWFHAPSDPSSFVLSGLVWSRLGSCAHPPALFPSLYTRRSLVRPQTIRVSFVVLTWPKKPQRTSTHLHTTWMGWIFCIGVLNLSISIDLLLSFLKVFS